MLRLAVITRYFPSASEPWQGRSTYETLRVIARRAEVRVFHAAPGNASPVECDQGTGNGYCASGIAASYYAFRALPGVSRPLNGMSVTRAVFNDVRGFAPDLIMGCFTYPDGYAALKIARALSVPAVVMGLGSDVNRIRDPFTAWQTRKVLRKADFIVTVSEDLRKKTLLLGAHPENTRTILNGCDLSVFQVRQRSSARQYLGMDPTARVILYVGRLDVRKGLRELVEAAVMVHRFRPDVQAYLVGEGPDRQLLQNEIRTRQAGAFVHLNPPCPFEIVAQWMGAADVVTLPSYMEGCPNVVLEALASGRPVVATAVGGIPEIVGEECGQLVRPRESGELARALAAVLERTWDPKAISALCSRSWETVGEELFEVFRDLVSGHRTIRRLHQMKTSSIAP